MDGVTIPSRLRENLAAAIAGRTDARQRLDEATKVVDRARAAVDAAARRFAAFDGVDAAVAEHRVAAIKAGDIAGALPADLAASRQAKRDAEQELADAQAALALVAAERDGLDAAARAAERAVAVAAGAIVADEVAEHAARLAAYQRAAFELKIELRGASDVWTQSDAGGVRPLALPRTAADAIIADPEPWRHVLPGENGPQATAMRRWADYLARLQQDADARLGVTGSLLL